MSAVLDYQRATLNMLGRRKAKRVTLRLVVVDQRVFEELRECAIDVFIRERAPTTSVVGH